MHLTKLRTVVGIGAVALALAGGLAADPADAKDRGRDGGRLAPLTCQGKVVTIVGRRNGLPNDQVLQIKGTAGADVILGTAGID